MLSFCAACYCLASALWYLALPVTNDYAEGENNKFTGKIHWVRVDLEEDNVSHMESEELKYHRALARQ